MRIRRRWKIALAVVLTGMVALVVGVVILLNSPCAARQAAQTLGAKLGGRVEIDAVSVGLSGTTVTGVRVFEPGALPDAIHHLAGWPALVAGARLIHRPKAALTS